MYVCNHYSISIGLLGFLIEKTDVIAIVCRHGKHNKLFAEQFWSFLLNCLVIVDSIDENQSFDHIIEATNIYTALDVSGPTI